MDYLVVLAVLASVGAVFDGVKMMSGGREQITQLEL